MNRDEKQLRQALQSVEDGLSHAYVVASLWADGIAQAAEKRHPDHALGHVWEVDSQYIAALNAMSEIRVLEQLVINGAAAIRALIDKAEGRAS